VHHPKHYNTGKIEVCAFIEDQRLGFHLGNVVKYVCRAGRKDKATRIQDLEKAVWYLQRKIEVLKAKRDKRATVQPNDMRNEHPRCRCEMVPAVINVRFNQDGAK
jgi:hypothetical protein